MVGIIYVYIDPIFPFYGYIFLYTHLWMFEHDCWKHAVLGVLHTCVVYFCICSCSAQLSMFHMERRSRNTSITIVVVVVNNFAKTERNFGTNIIVLL